ncbi:MAG: ARPP-1 family domain-containing protein [Myxococcota bacterium]
MTTHLHTPCPEITAFLESVALAPRQPHKALTLWPLVRREDAGPPAAPAPEYVSLETALAEGALEVDEVSEDGSVPHVRVVNRGATAVLVLFGEELRGAKQNRVANATFLVPAQSDTTLDVSCVEQGRWQRAEGARFESGLGVASHSLRARMAESVTASSLEGHGFRSDQAAVWDEVEDRITHSRTDSRTRAYADYFESRRHEVDEVCAAFHPVPGQLGFVAMVADRVVGLEAIGRPAVFAASFTSLLRSYAIDAVDTGLVGERDEPAPPEADTRRAPSYGQPEEFLHALALARASGTPSLGLGHDWRLRGDGLSGCALVAGEVVHLTAFAQGAG